MGVTEEGGTARGMLKERGDLKLWKEAPCWKNGRVNVKEEARGYRRNREGESGRETRDVAPQMGGRSLRGKKKDRFSARLYREREMGEKVEARRKWRKKDDDIWCIDARRKKVHVGETEKSLRRRQTRRRRNGDRSETGRPNSGQERDR